MPIIVKLEPESPPLAPRPPAPAFAVDPLNLALIKPADHEPLGEEEVVEVEIAAEPHPMQGRA